MTRLAAGALLAACVVPAGAAKAAAPAVDARAWFVQNPATGEILVSHRGLAPGGRVEIRDGVRLAGERPLVASRSVAAPGLPGRIAWYLRRTVHHVVALLP